MEKLYYAAQPFTGFGALALLISGRPLEAAAVLAAGILGGFALLCLAAWLRSPESFREHYQMAVARAEAEAALRRPLQR